MQNTSQRYKQIIADPSHRFEFSVVIGESGRLITERADTILFGGTAILVATSSAESGFREATVLKLETASELFGGTKPEVGGVISAQIDLQMFKPIAEIPRRAMIIPYIRVTDRRYGEPPTEENTSEWIRQGVFYVDTRSETHDGDGLDVLTLHGYDAILMTEQTYPSDTEHTYPLLDKTMVQHIADSIGVRVDGRTWDIMTDGYMFPLPAGYSSREVLGMIASAYAGIFIMSDAGELRLVQINGMPAETNLLIDHMGYTITFGAEEAVRIIV